MEKRYSRRAGIVPPDEELDQLGARLHDAMEAFERIRRESSARSAAARDDERRRIAAELHDGLGQSLSAIKLGAQTRFARMAGAHSECSRCDVVPGVIGELQACLEEVRRIAHDLHPSMLEELGLLPTLSWFARDIAERQPELAVEVRADLVEEQIPSGLRTVLFRLVQEAARNTATHASATRLAIRLEHSGRHLVLEVRDNGCGLDDSPATGGRYRGFGMRSMRDRVEATGGLFEVVSRPGGGTAVVARWPVAVPDDRSSSSA